MNQFTNMKIAWKVATLLLMLGVLTLGVAFMSYRTLHAVDAGYTTLATQELPANSDLARANRRAIELAYIAYRALVHEGSSAEARDAQEMLRNAYDRGRGNLEDAAETDPALTTAVAEVRTSYDRVYDIANQAIGLGIQGRRDEAVRLLAAADEELAAISTQLAELTYARVEASDRRTVELQAEAGSMSLWLLMISVVGVIFGLVIAIVTARAGIVAPLVRLQETMRRLAAGDNDVDVAGTDRTDEVGSMAKAVLVFRDAAIAQDKAAAEKARADTEQKFVVETISEKLASVSQGDLTAQIDVEFPPSFVALRSNFNAALTNLRNLIASVVESAHSLRTGSTEIAQASEDLARRTESNAASLEETSAALTQIDGRIKATAEAAGRTLTEADQATKTVSGGRSVADEAVQAMGRVCESARGIDEVIEGVDKIAFQTRVLAMNAAVEAGRAGDAGRGFAVVADLVSALAMRAEEEAKHARDQLTVTQSDIGIAVEAVQKIDNVLTDISSGMGDVHELLGGMASDNQAQASAITEISSAVNNMDQSTQQNAAMVEQTSAAARNLDLEAESLAEKASHFRVDDGTAPIRATATAAPKKTSAYASPVKALAAVAASRANGSGALANASAGDWRDF